jgi:hypothetical protein
MPLTVSRVTTNSRALAALHGLLNRVRDLGLVLISVPGSVPIDPD